MESIVLELSELLAALRMLNVSRIFGNWAFIIIVSTGLVLWMSLALWFFGRGVRKFRDQTAKAISTLAATPSIASDFAGSYEKVDATLRVLPVIGPPWREWSATLILPAQPGVAVRSTLRPHEYFTPELLRECDINPRLHQAMPNLLVGAGLLLTFLGLSIALNAAGTITAPSIASTDMRAGLQVLLSAASAKFVTSLVGLSCSLIYVWRRGSYLVDVERALDDFYAVLEERIPLATGASAQIEGNALLTRLLAVQEQFSNELATGIASKLDATFDTRLGEHIGPLREAIEKLSEGITSSSEDTLKALIEQFQKAVQGSAQQQMEQLVATLAQASGAMDGVRTGLTEAADRMAKAADQIAEQMGRNAEQAMQRITQQMEGLVEQLRTLSEQSRQAGNEAMAEAARRIGEAGDSFRRSAEEMAASLERNLAGLAARLGGESEAATRRMMEQIEAAITALRALAEENRTAGDESSRAMAERIAAAAEKFEQTAQQIASKLEGGAGDAAQRLVGAVEELKNQFAALVQDLGARTTAAGTQIVEEGQRGATALASAAQEAAQALRAGGEASAESLRSGGRDSSGEIRGASAELAAPARELAQRIVTLQAEAAGLARSLEGAREAAAAITSPLRDASGDLRKAAEAGQRSGAGLEQAVRRLTPLIEQLGGVTVEVRALQGQVGTLADRLSGAVSGFGDLDKSLAGTFRNLTTGLSGFSGQVTDFMTGTNSDMAQAMTKIQSAVEALTEAVEALEEALPKAGKDRRT